MSTSFTSSPQAMNLIANTDVRSERHNIFLTCPSSSRYIGSYPSEETTPYHRCFDYTMDHVTTLVFPFSEISILSDIQKESFRVDSLSFLSTKSVSSNGNNNSHFLSRKSRRYDSNALFSSRVCVHPLSGYNSSSLRSQIHLIPPEARYLSQSGTIYISYRCNFGYLDSGLSSCYHRNLPSEPTST